MLLGLVRVVTGHGPPSSGLQPSGNGKAVVVAPLRLLLTLTTKIILVGHNTLYCIVYQLR